MTWKCLFSRFMEDINKRRRIFLQFLFLNLSAVPKKLTPGKFAYTWHFQRIRINATKSEKSRIHSKRDVFAGDRVVDAKAPYCGEKKSYWVRRQTSLLYRCFQKRKITYTSVWGVNHLGAQSSLGEHSAIPINAIVTWPLMEAIPSYFYLNTVIFVFRVIQNRIIMAIICLAILGVIGLVIYYAMK